MVRANDNIDNTEVQEIEIGLEAAKLRHVLELSHPIKNGIVTNWKDMELVWRYGFEKVDEFILNVLIFY